MQFYSFDLHDPIFEIGGLKFSFQIVTLENIYGLDPSHTTLNESAGGWQIECSQLSWAGQQQHAPGALTVRVRRESDQRLRISMNARAPHKIRAVKMLIRDLPTISVLDLLDNDRPVPYDGVLDKYPNPLRLPLLFARLPDGQCLGLRSEDEHTRAKRFASYQERMGSLKGTYTIECIHEDDAHWFDTQTTVPDWVGRYVRLIGHICDSEPSRGSTGVFEWGYTPYKPLPNRDPYITTIAFTDGTLENAQAEIEAAIAQAKER
jgi:hypothetical protein